MDNPMMPGSMDPMQGQDPSMQQQGGPPQDPNQQMQPQMQQPQLQEDQGQEVDEDAQMENYLDYALSQTNLAKKYDDEDDETLTKMGMELTSAIEGDLESREPWMRANREWLDMALLVRKEKSWPWPKASNVKYPLIATAAMQFSARAYPALVPQDGKVVKASVVSKDPDGQLAEKATRVARHMSYQVMCKIPNWEEEMDKLLMTMAISGICFKKTYHNEQLNRHCSHLVYPENLIINYHAKNLEKAYRKTEVIFLSQNEVVEKVNNDEFFLDIEYTTPEVSQITEQKKPQATNIQPVKTDAATPHEFWVCHTYWDLDDDGYEEPYVVTIHKTTRKVVRIIARWCSDGVYRNTKGKVIRIEPVEYFTAFPFIPNPDGSVYASGFGMLLGPLNESINTLINQLVDAGTLANLGGGFVGRNLRIKMGQLQLRPGEWKVVNATGEDMAKSFYPNPSQAPSDVLFKLMEALITSGNQLASIAEIFVGKMPGQNTPATTTQETVQQSMAVFTAIYKRVYRSLQAEFKKIFRLNKITPGIVAEEMKYVGVELQQSDYEGTEDYIIPGADPTGDSASMKQQKLNQVGSLLQLGTINQMMFTQLYLDAYEIPNAQQLMQQPPPPPLDPKIQTEQMKQQTMQMKAQSDQQTAQQKLDIEKQLGEMKMQIEEMKLKFKEQEMALKLQGQQQQQEMDMVQGVNEMHQEQQMGEMEMAIAQKTAESDIATNEQLNKQKITQGDQVHKQKMAQAKETQKMKPKAKANGK